MVRALAEYDVERAKRVLRWPIREGLISYLELLRDRARRDYEIELLCWAVRSPYMKKGGQTPPKVPDLLKEA